MAQGPVKKAVDRSIHSFGLDAVHFSAFSAVSPGAGVASTTVQARKSLPVACKIPLVQAFFTAIQSLDGGHAFNIVVGEGAYDTQGVQASGTYTITGAPTTGQNNSYVIGGVTYNAAQTTSNTTTQQAAADVISLNALSGFSALYVASSATNVVTIKYLEAGPNGNGITTTGSGNAGDTLTANQAALAGGVAGSAIATPPADLTDLWGTPYAANAAVASGYAAAGNALFASDALFTATAGVGAPRFQPALAAPTTGSGGTLRYIPTVPDAIFPAGCDLTLRIVTPVGVGSISNLSVNVVLVPIMPVQQQPANNEYIVVGVDL